MFKQGAPAPVPADGLAAALAPFGQSRMLPREAYVDPAVFEWEQHNIFSGWTCVGHACDLAAVGAQKAVGTGPNAMLLVRGEDDVVRAFANTCRHRGHELLACNATTKGRAIVCPYHSWSYRLDGRLRNAPGFRDVEGFEPDEFGLAELRLVNWHGWLFVDASGEDAEFATHVAGLDEVVGAVPPRRPDDRRAAFLRARHQLEGDRRELPGVLPLLDHPSGAVPHQPADQRREPRPAGVVDGRLDVDHRGRRDHVADGQERRRRDPGAVRARTAHASCTSSAIPTCSSSLHPDYVMTHLMTPLAADRTHVECAWAFPKDVAAKPDFDPSYAVDFWDLTNRQDWAACESVQRGLTLTACAAGSAGARRGRRLPVRHPGG